jgi:hypothetical protein
MRNYAAETGADIQRPKFREVEVPYSVRLDDWKIIAGIWYYRGGNPYMGNREIGTVGLLLYH